MYIINDQVYQKCELIGKHGLPGQPPKIIKFFLKMILLSIALPAIIMIALSLEEGIHLGHLIPLGIFMVIFSLKSLIVWPSFPEKVVFDPTSRRVFLVDTKETMLEHSPSMSYEDIAQIKIQKRVERSNKHSVTRYYVTLIKKDSAQWQLIGPYRRRVKAENDLENLLKLSAWSINQDQSMKTVSDNAKISTWILPKRTDQLKRFTLESLGDYSLIKWHIKRPKNRAVALKAIAAGFVFIMVGASQLEGLAILLSPISLIICFLIFRSITQFKSEQEIKVFREYMELSSTGGWKGDAAQLYYDQLTGLALDFSKAGLKLRVVKNDDMSQIEKVDQALANAKIGDILSILKVFMNATYVNTYDLSAGEMLTLEGIIQDQVAEIGGHHLL